MVSSFVSFDVEVSWAPCECKLCVFMCVEYVENVFTEGGGAALRFAWATLEDALQGGRVVGGYDDLRGWGR